LVERGATGDATAAYSLERGVPVESVASEDAVGSSVEAGVVESVASSVVCSVGATSVVAVIGALLELVVAAARDDVGAGAAVEVVAVAGVVGSPPSPEEPLPQPTSSRAIEQLTAAPNFFIGMSI